MKKEINIGIYCWSTGDQSFGVSKNYLDFISQYGNPKMLTPDNTFDKSIDMLFLAGGMDLNPKAYGQAPGYFTSSTDVFKQHVYDSCLGNYLEYEVPVFGVCLGMQQLAVRFGSKLTQHLPFHTQSKYDAEPAHEYILDNQDIIDITQLYKDKVTSTHHQGILRKNLSKNLQSILFSRNEEFNIKGNVAFEEDIIEGFVHKSRFIAGVQSHPERHCPVIIARMMEYIVEAAERNKKQQQGYNKVSFHSFEKLELGSIPSEPMGKEQPYNPSEILVNEESFGDSEFSEEKVIQEKL